MQNNRPNTPNSNQRSRYAKRSYLPPTRRPNFGRSSKVKLITPVSKEIPSPSILVAQPPSFNKPPIKSQTSRTANSSPIRTAIKGITSKDHAVKNRLKIPKFSLKTFIVISAILLLFGGGFWLVNRDKIGVLSDQDTVIQPNFDALKTTSEDGGSKEAVFDPEKEIYTYQDQLEGNIITITQQPMPDDIKNDTEGIKKLALSLTGAVSIDRLNTNKGVLHLTQEENGSQRGVLGYNDLLLFLTSNQKISAPAWVDYVNGLQ
jgi:hypothetical protein